MSIIRSNIARQLLAEGGSPRASFRRGGGRTDANTMSGSGAAFDDGFGGGDEFGRDTYSDQLSDIQESNITGNTFPNISDVSGDDLRNISIRPDGTSGAGSIFDYTPINLLRRADEKFIGPFRDKSNLARRTEFLRRQGLIGPGEEELPVQFQDSFLKSEAGLDMLRGMGYTTIQDVINNRGEGGDNEPIKRLRAPITEKIEEEKPKNEFNELLKYYGARFEDGGEVRQNYGLGSIVKKIGRTVKKVAKSPIGKAALFAGLGAYGLGAGPFSSGKFGAGFLKSEGFKKFLLKDAAKGFKLNNISSLALLGVPTAASFLMAKKDEEEEETLPEVARSDPRFQSLINFYGGPRRFAQGGGDIDEAPIKDMPRQDMPRQEMASYGYDDAMAETYDSYLDMKKKGLIPPTMDFREFLLEVVPEMSKKQGIERLMASAPDPGAEMNDALEDLARKYYKKPLKDLTPDQILELENAIEEMSGIPSIKRTMAAEGGMMDLGGNEMDLRGGGFVPLGAKEKADDVPARLSKNEFVFTADAVRAAGGGSVDKGADVMYKTMKNLENKIA